MLRQPAMAAAARPTAHYAPQQAAPMGYAEPAYEREPAYAEAAPAMARRAPEPRPEPVAEMPRVIDKPHAKTQQRAPELPPKVEEELPSDDELDRMLGPSRDADAAKAFGVAAKDETTELDEEAIEKLPDPPALTPIAEEEDVDDDLDDIEPEDIPDPDPIPTVYAGDDDEDFDDDDRGSALQKLIAPTIAIVAVGVLIAGMILGREFIVSMWPGANAVFYDYIGMHVAVPGDGLERKLTRTAVETVANVDHVIATGTVANVSDMEQRVPTILVQLLDAKVQVLEEKEIKIEKAMLQPGEQVQFKAVFEGAPATARTVRTEWGRFAEAMQ